MNESRSERIGLIVAGAGVALVACCLCIAALTVCAWGILASEPPRATPTYGVTPGPTRTPRPPVTPSPITTATPRPTEAGATPSAGLKPPATLRRDPVTQDALDTARLLDSAIIPTRDLRDVTQRLVAEMRGTAIPQITRDRPWDFKLGDKHSFWVSREDDHQHFWITTTLIYITPHTYIWVEDGVKVNQGQLKAAADRFENTTYPTDREFFGGEWTPGVDRDVHLSLLISEKLGRSVAGYYNSMDEYSRLVNKYSNEMEMFYIKPSGAALGTDYFHCTLAHEFQHMIHWYHHQNQANWINEGLSDLACQLNGIDPGGHYYAFAAKPDTQLDGWPDEAGQAGPNYGAAYLFMSYFLDRFGEKATQALVSSSLYSAAAVDEVLRQSGARVTFDDVYADWVAANYINDPLVDRGQYAYTTIQPPSFDAILDLRQKDYPAQKEMTVSQYGTDYIELTGQRDVQVDFAGSTLVGLAPMTAHSGKHIWWAGAVNSSDTTLTREFDLSGVRSATLSFWTWHDIEQDWDYAYVEASTDGQYWKTLEGPSTTKNDPNGANYGNGYTGKSGVPASDKKGQAKWVQEKIDLSEYAGKKVHIRFEYITDQGVTHAGLFVDDIEIPEISYRDDAETGDGGWEAKGFVRHANVLPQRWLVQLITASQDGMTVERLPVEPDQTGRWNIRLGGDVDKAVIAISGLTRGTTETARYWLAITQP